MKSILNFLVIAICISCAGSKIPTVEEIGQSEFQIMKAEYAEWEGGIQNAGGIKVTIVVNKVDLKVDSVYFKNQRLNPELRKLNEKELLITASLYKSVKPDYNLHKEASMEYGNKVPKMNPTIPFKLNIDECVLRYIEKGKVHLLKVKLEKGETIFDQ